MSNVFANLKRPWLRSILITYFLCVSTLAYQTCEASPKEKSKAHGKSEKIQAPAASSAEPKPGELAYDYTLPGTDGKNVSLSAFRGKVLLIVNLARHSTYSAQLPALIKLSNTYRDRGLVVIGVPSNDFGASEPGSDAKVQKAYADAKAPFSVMATSKVSGDEELPFYRFLTTSQGAPAGGAVHWNYTKFLVDKNGKVVARLKPDVAPDSPEMISTVEEILAGTYKPGSGGIPSGTTESASEIE